MSIAEIRAAIEQELAATPEFYDFRVESSQREGTLWRVTLQAGQAWAGGKPMPQLMLDDSFDGATAWWGGPPKGQAAVLAVVAEDDQLVLADASAPPPALDGLIRLYPPRFLQPLAQAWADDAWAARAWAARAELAAPRRLGVAELARDAYGWLRPAQRRAYGLPQHSASFLWGPPGSGKTTTLGVLLAELLQQRPEARVLLLSTTHTAVDQAVIALDKALAQKRREALRASVRRLGTRFSAAAYEGREHLLAVRDPALVAQLAKAEAARPRGHDLAALQAWQDRVDGLRRQLRSASLAELRSARLVAMTTSRASYTLRTLRELAEGDEAPFDLVVFDEASQVSLAQALALAPLGRARLHAGDPQQLAPVRRSEAREAKVWLGRSAFGEMPRARAVLDDPQGPVALLDEQSRMAAPIGELVSALFYDGLLRVADDARAQPAWLARRARSLDGIGPEEQVRIEPVEACGGWSAHHRGPVRPGSAQAIAARVGRALAAGEAEPAEIVVLTPFRAQRAVIRQALQAHELSHLCAQVRVSTVHKAQGSEAPFVLFDPVDGRQPFLQTEDARRLVNVALSRAQAKVIVYLAEGDAQANPVLGQIVQRLRLAGDTRPVRPIEALARDSGFPRAAVGLRVRIGRHVGEVARISPDGSELWLHDEASGEARRFDVGFLRRKAGAAPA
ncbi:DEAD/DEAH box helicase [Leptothrix discophora]|uniref:AAA domain-containing protein n=1 Tax=Leptothrix discophora TaxID=89 RepID=A0ABT9G7X3_LEPDI|nr:AAA domain-containing protein [Leptothrix discophora]MDP4302372.1 AAA domain-containing protein [Leptothrix discophora]